jgi:hypothetical protein
MKPQPLKSALNPQEFLHPRVQNHAPLAAVAYLNMLPFFVDDDLFELHASPRALNQSSLKCAAYCSSLVAGLAAGRRPLSNRIGVFSSGAVHSVFLEPMIYSEAHALFWQQMEKLWSCRHPDAVAGLKSSACQGHIVLRSAGASEQSEWMVKVLCALAGFKVDVDYDPQPFPMHPSQPSLPLDLLQTPSTPITRPPEVRLWIGDAALERRLVSPNVYRIDVGHVWTNHTGMRAWFAGWFAGLSDSQIAEGELTDLMMKRIEQWNGRSDFSRWCAVHSFLNARESGLLSRAVQDEQHWELRDAVGEYFTHLEHVIDDVEGQRLSDFYFNVHAAFQDCELNWNGVHCALQQQNQPEHLNLT